ncbi:DUF3667 domain-containing protein [Chryseobacterium camelliae]|uniref:DUF3667 domain-containing protein n=1 Tax=Chryseobacterium camelliae TaxID=1265445 RepID=A0ABY7QSS2_9FLAO|nr:DUF3667 domain-containing protein [Chryseobacterium camelliae]WBV61992.1 DUF3667 domain-containing protein [Chryseobacterium camelliae]
MSHGKTRENKTCLNCGHTVEERFCPHCGQENIEPKQPFHFLFTHFIEDFTHYDGEFWKTIKYLLLRPGKLTREYLAGKRQMYVAPVKLYIFISFITFFLPSLFSDSEEEATEHDKKTHVAKKEEEKTKDGKTAKFTDSLQQHLSKEQLSKKPQSQASKDLKVTEVNGNNIDTDALGETEDGRLSVLGTRNMKQYDSLYTKDKGNAFLYSFMKPFAKKIFHMQEQGLKKELIMDKFKETFVHTLPKALFVYLPIFAFFLWIFHSKKKWWYFDHGIFTLHYFSFLLLGTLILICLDKITDLLPNYGVLNLLTILINIAAITYMSIYFFIAHHRVYESSRAMSVFKGIFLFMINFIGVLCMGLLLMYVSFLMMH